MISGALPNGARAAPVLGSTLAPNWNLGIPQRPFIGMCSDFPGACFGNFGLGPQSDVLNIFWAGTAAIVQASLREGPGQQFVGGLLESADESAAEWWDLTVPNTVWVGIPLGFGVVYYLNDGSQPAGFASDAIAFANTGPGGLAQIWWASVYDPPDTTLLPVDFQIDVALFTPEDLTGSHNFDPASFSPQIPDAQPCNPDDPNLTGTSSTTLACIADDALAGPRLPTVPEPGTVVLFVTGLLGMGTMVRRRAVRRRAA
jgi:hypothetical protein